MLQEGIVRRLKLLAVNRYTSPCLHLTDNNFTINYGKTEITIFSIIIIIPDLHARRKNAKAKLRAAFDPTCANPKVAMFVGSFDPDGADILK